MAVNAENLTFNDLKQITEGLSMRQTSHMVTPDLPRGSFDWLSFPLPAPLSTSSVPSQGTSLTLTSVSWGACKRKSLRRRTYNFSFHHRVPLQMVILKDAEGRHAMLKHLAFPDKVTPSFWQGTRNVFGTLQRAKWMSAKPKSGRKVLQYCLEG